MSASWDELQAAWDEAGREHDKRTGRATVEDILGRAVASAKSDPNRFWDWVIDLRPERRRNGSLLSNVLWRWGAAARPTLSAERLERLKAGDEAALRDFFEEREALKARSRIPVPGRALRPMLRFAVEEDCPSFNRNFVEPCVWAFGRKAVTEILLEFLENGTPAEKGRAASALYWTSFGPDDRGEELKRRLEKTKLEQFLATDDLDARRRILPGLALVPARLDEDLRPLAAKVVEVARSSPDEYLRHRVEVQLGSGGPYAPLPTAANR